MKRSRQYCKDITEIREANESFEETNEEEDRDHHEMAQNTIEELYATIAKKEEEEKTVHQKCWNIKAKEENNH